MPFRLLDPLSQPPVPIQREPGLTGHVRTGRAITGSEVEEQLVVRAVPRIRQADAWSSDRATPTAVAAHRGEPSGTTVTDTAPVGGRPGPRRGARGGGVIASSALVVLAALAVVASGGSPKLPAPLADTPLSALPFPADGQMTVQAAWRHDHTLVRDDAACRCSDRPGRAARRGNRAQPTEAWPRKLVGHGDAGASRGRVSVCSSSVRLDTDSGSGGIADRVPAAGLGAVADAIRTTVGNPDPGATPDARADRDADS